MSDKPKKLFFKHIVRKIFLEDWGLKLLALVITIGLWFGVTGLSTPSDRRLDVPFNIYISNNSEVTNSIPQDINIVISGDKRRIDQIRQTDLVAALDLSAKPPGDYSITLSPENIYVQLPQGIRLTQVSPNRIPVNIEAVEERDIDVKVVTSGTLPAGYEIYASNAVPPKIRVRGPASFMKGLDFVETAPIDIVGHMDDFTAKQIPVSVSNPKASVLNTVVDVYFRIGETRRERSFRVTAGSGKSASFSIFGPRALVESLRADSFKIEITKGDIGEDIPRLVLPPEIEGLVEVRNLIVK